MQELWRDKEQMLENFYAQGIPFPASSRATRQPKTPIPIQYLTLASWLALVYYALSALLFSLWGVLWIAVTSSAMLAVSRYTDGLQELEIIVETKGLLKASASKAFVKRREERKKKNV